MNRHPSSSSRLNSPSSPSTGTSNSNTSKSSNSLNLHSLNCAGNSHSSNSNNANQISISIPSAPNHHHHSVFNCQAYQSTRFSNSPHQLSVPPSSSLPNHLGSWSDHLDSLNFGSVPSSPIIEVANQSSPQIGTLDPRHHHRLPSQPFPSSFQSPLLHRSSQLSSLHHHNNHSLTHLATDPIGPQVHPSYPSSPDPQPSHLPNFNQHALQARPLLIPDPPSVPTCSVSSSRLLSNSLSPQAHPRPTSPSSFSNSHPTSTDNIPRLPTSKSGGYPSLLHPSHLSDTLGRAPFTCDHSPNWDSAGINSPENRSQPLLKLAADAIYVTHGPSNHAARASSSEWTNSPSDRLPWSLRDPASMLGSPSSTTQSPSSMYSAWCLPTPADDSTMYGSRPTSTLRSHGSLASQLWQLYGSGDQRAPFNDTLESLIRRLTGLGLDADQIRQQLNSHDWKDGLMKEEMLSSGWSIDTSVSSKPPTQNQSTVSEPGSGSSSDKNNSTNATIRHTQLPKINENTQQSSSKSDSIKHSLPSREPSLERGRNLGSTRRAACNLAGRWQETNYFNPSSMTSDMDWSAQSRSRSRHQGTNCMDWRQDSSSSSRRHEFRNDLMMPGQSSEEVTNPSNTNIPQRHKSCTESSQSHLINLFLGLDTPQSTSNVNGTDEITNPGPYQDSLIEQLIGSYNAQQSEETRLHSLSEKDSDHLSLHGFFQPSSIPHSECGFGQWHLPIKPSQHSLLGSVPGLTQDFANLANAHAEYGYIPRLVRKTSFDEILAQQHHQKRGLNSTNRSPSRLQNASCSTLESLARPNTATDTRDRLGFSTNYLGKQIEDESNTSFSAESNTQAAYFELLSSALNHNDFSELGSKSHFQPSRFNQNSISSDDLSFRNSDNLLEPLFDADSTSFVNRITPHDLLDGLDQFDKTPVPQNTHSQWLQDSVAPAAVQPTNEDPTKKAQADRFTRSPSCSSSSEVSSKSSAPPQTDTGNREQKVKKDVIGQVQPNMGFSGGRCSHMSSIGEARKRTKQLPYSSGDTLNSNNAISSGLISGQPKSSTQCLNCQTTETPLWRRDSAGRPLCNACGLFVNLHGTPRPAGLSKGVIKRRNRGKNREKNMNTHNPNEPQTYPKNPSLGGGQRDVNQNYSIDQTGSNVDSNNCAPSTS